MRHPITRFYFYRIHILCILAICGCQTDTPTDVGDTPTPAPEPIDTFARLSLTFVGDIMGHGPQIRAAYNPTTKQYDYESCFRYIRPILEEADVAIGNLEVTLSNKGRYSGYPMFRSPDVLAAYLQQAGFDYLVTANNHSNDNRLYGVVHTIETLDSLGILHTGTFVDSQTYKTTYPHIWWATNGQDSFKLAMLNYTYGTNGMPTVKPSVVNEIDSVQIKQDIEKARAAQPDMIIAFMHWGHEYHLNEHHTQQALCAMLWREGVDLVVGAHPHVIQPIKTDTLWRADSTQRPVIAAYSLGNFISNQQKTNTDIGLIFSVDLVKNRLTQRTTVDAPEYILAWRYIENRTGQAPKRTHTVLPVSAFEQDSSHLMAMPASERAKMLKVTARMRKHLARFEGTERQVAPTLIFEAQTDTSALIQ